MFFGKFVCNPSNNPNIYNVKGDNMLSPSLKPLTTGSELKIQDVFQSGSVIVFDIQEIILLSSAKQNI